MKKLLSMLLLLIPIVAFSQLHTDAGLGYDYNTQRAVVTWSVGYDYKGFNADIEIRPTISPNQYAGKYIGGKFGIDVLHNSWLNDYDISIVPSVGYYSNQLISAKNIQNEWCSSYSVKVIAPAFEVPIFLDIAYINESVQTVIGVHYVFD